MANAEGRLGRLRYPGRLRCRTPDGSDDGDVRNRRPRQKPVPRRPQRFRPSRSEWVEKPLFANQCQVFAAEEHIRMRKLQYEKREKTQRAPQRITPGDPQSNDATVRQSGKVERRQNCKDCFLRPRDERQSEENA